MLGCRGREDETGTTCTRHVGQTVIRDRCRGRAGGPQVQCGPSCSRLPPARDPRVNAMPPPRPEETGPDGPASTRRPLGEATESPSRGHRSVGQRPPRDRAGGRSDRRRRRRPSVPGIRGRTRWGCTATSVRPHPVQSSASSGRSASLAAGRRPRRRPPRRSIARASPPRPHAGCGARAPRHGRTARRCPERTHSGLFRPHAQRRRRTSGRRSLDRRRSVRGRTAVLQRSARPGRLSTPLPRARVRHGHATMPAVLATVPAARCAQHPQPRGLAEHTKKYSTASLDVTRGRLGVKPLFIAFVTGRTGWE